MNMSILIVEGNLGMGEHYSRNAQLLEETLSKEGHSVDVCSTLLGNLSDYNVAVVSHPLSDDARRLYLETKENLKVLSCIVMDPLTQKLGLVGSDPIFHYYVRNLLHSDYENQQIAQVVTNLVAGIDGCGIRKDQSRTLGSIVEYDLVRASSEKTAHQKSLF